MNLRKGKIQKIETFDRVIKYDSADKLLKEKDRWKRFRDLNIIGLAAFYGLNIIDASVFCHLYDFDISDDLVINFRPNFINISNESVNFGLTLSMNF